MIPEIKSSMAMQEETEETRHRKLDDEGDQGDKERRDREEEQDGYDRDHPRAALRKISGVGGQTRAPSVGRGRQRSRTKPPAMTAVRLRMLMDADETG